MKPNKIFLVNSGCGLADREETAESERGVLCSKCANKEVELTLGDDPQWQIVDADINYEDNDINYEDNDLFCDHCGERCEAAYV